MRSSNKYLCWVAAFTTAASAHARADELTLAGDARLSGKIRSVSKEGVVELVSDLSPETLQLRPDAVRKMTFPEPDSGGEMPGSLIELVNGDLLPIIIKGFDGKVLDAVMPDAGPVSIPRESLSSLQIGLRRQKAIYSGPRGPEEWSGDTDGARSWRFTKGALSANGPAVAIRKIEVPSRFVFKFTLKWQMNPNFTVFFTDPLPKADQADRQVDRYFFQFSASGMEVKRESSIGQKTQSVILLNRTADDFPTSQVEVQIRVDRKSSRIDLLLDGEPEATGLDPVTTPPSGSGFVFVSGSPSGTPQEVRGIEVLDFDNSKERHRSEERGDTRIDSMISRDEDRWGGHLTAIRHQEEGAVFTFKSDFRDDALELMEQDVSTVFFARPEKNPALREQVPWVLKLRGGGVLHMTSCGFSESGVTARHPLLGELVIGRNGVSALERQEPGENPKIKQ